MSDAAVIDPSLIRIRGARTRNLKNLNVDLPAGRLIVITGVSGSGKSSLAFETLFAEGQRRYLESVSVQTRALLRQLPRPDVDDILGLAPTISVDQSTGYIPARSTLAMLTEIHDYLRVLYARAGTAHCTRCGKPVQRQSIDHILSRLRGLGDRTRLMILSPMVRGRRGAHRDVLERIARHGFVRARIDGQLVDLAELPSLSPGKSHTIDAVVDRIVIKEGIDHRLRESLELACRESDGTCIVTHEADGTWSEAFYSTRFSCPDCDLSFSTPEPRSFNHNSPWGACPVCSGFGATEASRCEACDGSRLQEFARRVTFQGTSLAGFLQCTVDEARRLVDLWLEHLAEPEGRAAVSMPDVSRDAREVAVRTLPAVRARLQCLVDTGIGYLTLDRASRTLSGGEAQRAKLAAALTSPVSGAIVILDEPTCGLHPRDTNLLLTALERLRDDGSTVIVVEHDPDIMRAADWLIDLGPGAGSDGGQLLFSGTPADAMATAATPTAACLRRSAASVMPAPTARCGSDEAIVVNNARLHNLQGVTVRFPLRRLICVTGVSGSGKSSLVMGTLLPCVASAIGERTDVQDVPTPAADTRCDGLEGGESVRRVISVDHRSPGTSSRSCLATLCGIWDDVRNLFASTRDARARGFRSTHFSFNSGPGRCPLCRGTGLKQMKMSFLPETVVPCPDCHGRRFTAAVNSVTYRDRTVADVLAMRVDEAVEFFAEQAKLHSTLATLQDVGLGYISLGQPASSYSGGESQRAKLACELNRPESDQTLYVLDEPTRGLHATDIETLVRHLGRLVDAGHSVLVVEHNLDVIRAADWVIDIGPGSGDSGGRVVFTGRPEDLVSCPESFTAAALSRCG